MLGYSTGDWFGSNEGEGDFVALALEVDAAELPSPADPSSSNTLDIVGGVVGGIAAVVLIAAAVALWRRWYPLHKMKVSSSPRRSAAVGRGGSLFEMHVETLSKGIPGGSSPAAVSKAPTVSSSDKSDHGVVGHDQGLVSGKPAGSPIFPSAVAQEAPGRPRNLSGAAATAIVSGGMAAGDSPLIVDIEEGTTGTSSSSGTATATTAFNRTPDGGFGSPPRTASFFFKATTPLPSESGSGGGIGSDVSVRRDVEDGLGISCKGVDKAASKGCHMAQAVLEAAGALAEQSGVPGVCQTAMLVSMLVKLAADCRENAAALEWRVKWCRSILMTLESAEEVLGKVKEAHSDRVQ